jgi:hypothetical protein
MPCMQAVILLPQTCWRRGNDHPQSTPFRSVNSHPLLRPIRRGVSKGAEDGYPKNARKTVLWVAHPQSVEGSGLAGPNETLESPWIPLAIWACPYLVDWLVEGLSLTRDEQLEE